MKRQNWGPAEEPRQERVDREMDPWGSSVKGAVPPGGGMGGQSLDFVTASWMQVFVLESLAGGVSQSHSQEPNDASRKIRTTKESGDGESGVERKNWIRRHSGREQEASDRSR